MAIHREAGKAACSRSSPPSCSPSSCYSSPSSLESCSPADCALAALPWTSEQLWWSLEDSLHRLKNAHKLFSSSSASLFRSPREIILFSLLLRFARAASSPAADPDTPASDEGLPRGSRAAAQSSPLIHQQVNLLVTVVEREIRCACARVEAKECDFFRGASEQTLLPAGWADAFRDSPSSALAALASVSPAEAAELAQEGAEDSAFQIFCRGTTEILRAALLLSAAGSWLPPASLASSTSADASSFSLSLAASLVAAAAELLRAAVVRGGEGADSSLAILEKASAGAASADAREAEEGDDACDALSASLAALFSLFSQCLRAFLFAAARLRLRPQSAAQVCSLLCQTPAPSSPSLPSAAAAPRVAPKPLLWLLFYVQGLAHAAQTEIQTRGAFPDDASALEAARTKSQQKRKRSEARWASAAAALWAAAEGAKTQIAAVFSLLVSHTHTDVLAFLRSHAFSTFVDSQLAAEQKALEAASRAATGDADDGSEARPLPEDEKSQLEEDPKGGGSRSHSGKPSSAQRLAACLTCVVATQFELERAARAGDKNRETEPSAEAGARGSGGRRSLLALRDRLATAGVFLLLPPLASQLMTQLARALEDKLAGAAGERGFPEATVASAGAPAAAFASAAVKPFHGFLFFLEILAPLQRLFAAPSTAAATPPPPREPVRREKRKRDKARADEVTGEGRGAPAVSALDGYLLFLKETELNSLVVTWRFITSSSSSLPLLSLRDDALGLQHNSLISFACSLVVRLASTLAHAERTGLFCPASSAAPRSSAEFACARASVLRQLQRLWESLSIAVQHSPAFAEERLLLPLFALAERERDLLLPWTLARRDAESPGRDALQLRSLLSPSIAAGLATPSASSPTLAGCAAALPSEAFLASLFSTFASLHDLPSLLTRLQTWLSLSASSAAQPASSADDAAAKEERGGGNVFAQKLLRGLAQLQQEGGERMQARTAGRQEEAEAEEAAAACGAPRFSGGFCLSAAVVDRVESLAQATLPAQLAPLASQFLALLTQTDAAYRRARCAWKKVPTGAQEEEPAEKERVQFWEKRIVAVCAGRALLAAFLRGVQALRGSRRNQQLAGRHLEAALPALEAFWSRATAFALDSLRRDEATPVFREALPLPAAREEDEGCAAVRRLHALWTASHSSLLLALGGVAALLKAYEVPALPAGRSAEDDAEGAAVGKSEKRALERDLKAQLLRLVDAALRRPNKKERREARAQSVDARSPFPSPPASHLAVEAGLLVLLLSRNDDMRGSHDTQQTDEAADARVAARLLRWLAGAQRRGGPSSSLAGPAEFLVDHLPLLFKALRSRGAKVSAFAGLERLPSAAALSYADFLGIAHAALELCCGAGRRALPALFDVQAFQPFVLRAFAEKLRAAREAFEGLLVADGEPTADAAQKKQRTTADEDAEGAEAALESQSRKKRKTKGGDDGEAPRESTPQRDAETLRQVEEPVAAARELTKLVQFFLAQLPPLYASLAIRAPKICGERTEDAEERPPLLDVQEELWRALAAVLQAHATHSGLARRTESFSSLPPRAALALCSSPSAPACSFCAPLFASLEVELLQALARTVACGGAVRAPAALATLLRARVGGPKSLVSFPCFDSPSSACLSLSSLSASSALSSCAGGREVCAADELVRGLLQLVASHVALAGEAAPKERADEASRCRGEVKEETQRAHASEACRVDERRLLATVEEGERAEKLGEALADLLWEVDARTAAEPEQAHAEEEGPRDEEHKMREGTAEGDRGCGEDGAGVQILAQIFSSVLALGSAYEEAEPRGDAATGADALEKKKRRTEAKERAREAAREDGGDGGDAGRARPCPHDGGLLARAVAARIASQLRPASPRAAAQGSFKALFASAHSAASAPVSAPSLSSLRLSRLLLACVQRAAAHAATWRRAHHEDGWRSSARRHRGAESAVPANVSARGELRGRCAELVARFLRALREQLTPARLFQCMAAQCLALRSRSRASPPPVRAASAAAEDAEAGAGDDDVRAQHAAVETARLAWSALALIAWAAREETTAKTPRSDATADRTDPEAPARVCAAEALAGFCAQGDDGTAAARAEGRLLSALSEAASLSKSRDACADISAFLELLGDGLRLLQGEGGGSEAQAASAASAASGSRGAASLSPLSPCPLARRDCSSASCAWAAASGGAPRLFVQVLNSCRSDPPRASVGCEASLGPAEGRLREAAATHRLAARLCATLLRRSLALALLFLTSLWGAARRPRSAPRENEAAEGDGEEDGRDLHRAFENAWVSRTRALTDLLLAMTTDEIGEASASLAARPPPRETPPFGEDEEETRVERQPPRRAQTGRDQCWRALMHDLPSSLFIQILCRLESAAASSLAELSALSPPFVSSSFSPPSSSCAAARYASFRRAALQSAAVAEALSSLLSERQELIRCLRVAFVRCSSSSLSSRRSPPLVEILCVVLQTLQGACARTCEADRLSLVDAQEKNRENFLSEISQVFPTHAPGVPEAAGRPHARRETVSVSDRALAERWSLVVQQGLCQRLGHATCALAGAAFFLAGEARKRSLRFSEKAGGDAAAAAPALTQLEALGAQVACGARLFTDLLTQQYAETRAPVVASSSSFSSSSLQRGLVEALQSQTGRHLHALVLLLLHPRLRQQSLENAVTGLFGDVLRLLPLAPHLFTSSDLVDFLARALERLNHFLAAGTSSFALKHAIRRLLLLLASEIVSVRHVLNVLVIHISSNAHALLAFAPSLSPLGEDEARAAPPETEPEQPSPAAPASAGVRLGARPLEALLRQVLAREETQSRLEGADAGEKAKYCWIERERARELSWQSSRKKFVAQVQRLQQALVPVLHAALEGGTSGDRGEDEVNFVLASIVDSRTRAQLVDAIKQFQQYHKFRGKT
ncbi:hypothetical protein BESB_011820 [Besnoitia besnoiti]|uniref:Uncharacterized protein n=1 Tax=Besnoitia besnoiti TaxID=94643 RepID=A0A2A9MB13_BESBE|nr:hypothetical protein BESB_011820 [Besnoitia besnoiti]PFH32570.1 hypothetical protein BESB_011820 [Besnoitia besnoiti]